jgi:hypothetical protein
VRLGREAEFQQALREFFQASFAHGGVLGATMIVLSPGSDSREFAPPADGYGIGVLG